MEHSEQWMELKGHQNLNIIARTYSNRNTCANIRTNIRSSCRSPRSFAALQAVRLLKQLLAQQALRLAPQAAHHQHPLQKHPLRQVPLVVHQVALPKRLRQNSSGHQAPGRPPKRPSISTPYRNTHSDRRSREEEKRSNRPKNKQTKRQNHLLRFRKNNLQLKNQLMLPRKPLKKFLSLLLQNQKNQSNRQKM